MKNAVAALAFALIGYMTLSVNSADVSASDATWLNTTPTVETLPTFVPQPGCTEQLVEIANESTVAPICVYQGNDFRFGIYTPARSWYEPVVSFLVFSYKNDSQMYVIFHVSMYPFNTAAVYLGNNGNDLVFHNDSAGWRAIKNIRSKLVPVRNNFGKTLYYEAPLPEVLFYKSPTNFDASYGFSTIHGISANGKWLVIMNIPTRVAVRVNLTDYSSTMFSKNIAIDTEYSSFLYSSNFSISNDGRYIAVMGGAVPFVIFDINDQCGVHVKNHELTDFSVDLANPCQYKSMENVVGQRYDIYEGSFNKSATRITVRQDYIEQDEQKVKWIRLTLPGVIGNDLTYLALGDSFASGEGETDDKYYFAGTNVKHEKCHISSRSYPFLLANELGIRNDTRSVACSGAKMEDITNSKTDYLGQDQRLSRTIENFDNTDLPRIQTDAIQRYIPGRTDQLDFVEEYNPKVVTISIGGNDTGLVAKLATCLDNNDCHWTDDDHRPKIAQEIKSKFSDLVNTYSKIKNTSPGVKLYVIGYPRIFDEYSDDCGFLLGNRLSKKEREFGNQAVSYLNSVIAAAARSAGVRYVDNNEAFNTKKLCSSDKPHALNGISIGDDTNTKNEDRNPRIIGQESFHPNPLGFDLLKQSIKSAVPNIKDYVYCSSEETCATNESAPEPSSYWNLSAQENLEILTETTCIEPIDGQKGEIKLTIPNFSAKANAPLNVTVRSEPQSLGQITTDGDGGYSGRLSLPEDLEPGHHTLHLVGESYSGEPIDLYQIFIVNEDGTYSLPGADTSEETEATSINSDPDHTQSSSKAVQTHSATDNRSNDTEKKAAEYTEDKAKPTTKPEKVSDSDSHVSTKPAALTVKDVTMPFEAIISAAVVVILLSIAGLTTWRYRAKNK
ncbi:hypothetical protein A2707_04535 [Candidatus Saccharibacteria bacterium RIFCSPHIGHO2_01_FULL_45_15]|nr:MAG: hypothetical protein A2707_04535 [Candidatus Saccharibacteria bacterium RIFCSPHIGHO2_01_FULL_45_15]OGL32758.1 MAG: hypothetical protein A3E76_05425 [Candidatus Saccharibacteria bacterium RIFCSPHIGHO2_12_FULL_44_22]